MQHKNSLRGGFAYALPLLVLGVVIIIGVVVLVTTNVGQRLTTSFTIKSSGQLLEAEVFTLVSPLTVGTDPLAFGGKYVSAETGSSINTPSKAEGAFSIYVPSRGTYYIWARMMGPSSGKDAMYIGIDSSWDRAFPVNASVYEWVKIEKSNGSGSYGFKLSAGTHKLKVTHGELSARVDALYISTNSSAALPNPPPPSMDQLYEAESFTLSSPMVVGTDDQALNGKYISANSGSNTSTPAPEATLSISVPATNTYYIWARVLGPTSGSDASYIGIDSMWDRVFPDGVGAYEWIKVETTNGSGSNAFSLTQGAHTLKIGHGEILARVDAIYVSTNSNPALPTPTVTSPPPTPAPTVSFSASPASITSGESSMLTWASTDATSCTASGGWTGTKLTSGSQSVSPTVNTTYALTCVGAGGSASKSASISVSAPIVILDTTFPTVSISSPTTGTSYTSAQTVSIQATASDNVGVAKVEFYDGATLKGTDTSSPYSYSWAFTSADNGTHSWTAKAYDAAGNIKVSTAITLTVNIAVTTGGGSVISSFTEGFGATIGGYSQPVYYVTNLSDSGAGSLRDAVSTGNRYVKFLVGGTINPSNDITISVPNLTIDGLAAPAPGILVNGKGLRITGVNAHDIIVSGISFRNSAGGTSQGDAISIGSSNVDGDERQVEDARRVVIDHVSTYLAADGAIDVGHGAHDITVQWSIFGPNVASHNLLSLNKYQTERVTYHHNAFVKGYNRMPQADWQLDATSFPPHNDVVVDFRNNLIWDHQGTASQVHNGGFANLINNYYYSSVGAKAIGIQDTSGSKAYTAGNVSQNGTSLNGIGNISTPFPAATVSSQTDACTAAKAVKAQAGPKGANFGLDTLDQGFVNSMNITCS